MTDEPDPLTPIREHEETIRECVAGRDDELGAAGRCLLALAHDEPPAPEDAAALGLPIDDSSGANGGGEV